jgi:predicted transcriptional regulator
VSDQLSERGELLSFTSDIVAAYSGNNALPNQELPGLIGTVFAALSGLGTPPAQPLPVPAVPIARSVTRSSVFCLECGKPNKLLKRHLRTAHNLSPEEYRAKWGLAPTHPIIAPDYAAHRSALAKKIGLGRKAAAQPVRGKKK